MLEYLKKLIILKFPTSCLIIVCVILSRHYCTQECTILILNNADEVFRYKKRDTNCVSFSRSEPDSNRCKRFCRPLPSRSAIRPFEECKNNRLSYYSQTISKINYFPVGHCNNPVGSVCKIFIVGNNQ